jgi:dihydropteroate synthase
LAHNLELLSGLDRLAGLGAPVVVGLSRKSMLGAITGRAVGNRLAASLGAAMLAVQRGATVLRVHDVAETVDVLGLLEAIDAQDRMRI